MSFVLKFESFQSDLAAEGAGALVLVASVASFADCLPSPLSSFFFFVATSAAGQHGGHETTVLTTLPFFAHHGVIFVPVRPSFILPFLERFSLSLTSLPPTRPSTFSDRIRQV